MLFLPLFAALTFSAAAAAKPSSYETVWRQARTTLERDAAAAMKMVDDALARAGNSDEHDVWKLRVFRAVLLIQKQEFDEAAIVLVAPLPRQLRNTEVAARHLHARAMLEHAKVGAAPLELLEQARVIAVKTAPGLLSEILRVSKRESDVREAIVAARKAGDEFLVIKAEVSLVHRLADDQRYAEAVELGEQLLPRLQSRRMHNTLARHLGNLGWAYEELGNHERAAELLMRAVEECTRIQNLTDQRTWYATLTQVHLARRDWPAAERDARKVIAATEGQTHRSRGRAFTTLARVYLETGRLAEARTAVRQARALESKDDDLVTRVVEARVDIASGAHPVAQKTLEAIIAATPDAGTKFEALGQLARVYALTKKNDVALRTFDAAVALVRDARHNTAGLEMRLTVFNNAAELFDNYVDYLVDAGRPADALRVAENSRAQMLAEARDVNVDRGVSPAEIARQRGATILCYWLGHRRSYVWTITAAGVQLTPLGKSESEIDAAVARYAATLVTAAGTLERNGVRGQALYDLLVARAGVPAGARVIVIPDGTLHTLNFDTLVTPKKRYWIEDVTIANASSLQLLARATTPRPAASKLLLVGNPPQEDPAFPALAQAEDEIRRIANRFAGRATILAGPNATPAAYQAAKPASYDFVHFAAHGTATRVRPLDSAVILGRDKKTNNYRLVARDIAGQPLAAWLVTISSCHGAGTTTYAGEGLVGLAWAFRHAGARQVVAALWAVNDTAAPKLMDRMYAGITAGRDPAVALRDAKLALLRSNTSHRHARYWAPFVIYQ